MSDIVSCGGVSDVFLFNGVLDVGRRSCRSIYVVLYRLSELPVNIYCIDLDALGPFDGVVLDLVIVSVVAVLVDKAAAVADEYLANGCSYWLLCWAIQVILIRTAETKTTAHMQLVVVKAF